MRIITYLCQLPDLLPTPL